MRKAKLAVTLVGAFIILLTSTLTAPLKAGSLGIGVSGEALYMSATGTESLKGAAAAGGPRHSAYAGAASFFAQYTFMDDGFVIGVERIPYEASLGKVNRSTTQCNSLDTCAAGTALDIDQHVEAALKNHTTVYFETPGLGGGGSGGLYLTGGWTTVDLLTQEKLGSGSSYPDAEIDGYTIGIGIKSGTDSGMLAKIVAEYTDYESIQLKSTGSDTSSTIDATLDTMSIKVSVGYSF